MPCGVAVYLLTISTIFAASGQSPAQILGIGIDGALHHPCLLPPWRSLYRVQQLSILG